MTAEERTPDRGPESAKEPRPERTPEEYRFEQFESGRPRFVSGIFDDVEEAERAAQVLEERGYPQDEIVVLLSREARDDYLSTRKVYRDQSGRTYLSKENVQLEKGSRALEGTGAGAMIGGAVGAVAAAVATVGTSVLIPPLGIIVAGPVVAALAGAGAGGAAGGLVGTLVGAGMSEYRAKRIDERLRKGGVVVGVQALDEIEAEEIENDLAGQGAEVVRESAAS